MGNTPLGTAEVAALSTDEIMDLAADTSRRLASLAGLIVQLTAELDRREGWRVEGATSLEAWIVERCGVSVPTARAWSHVGKRLFDLPHLAAGLSGGELSFDKVRAVADSATPETDRDFRDRAQQCSVRQLAELARAEKGAPEAAAQADYEGRSVRFNDTFRTVTAQLPPESYAEVRATIEARARQLPSDGETRWEQRLCDAFVASVRPGPRGTKGPPPHTVVVHAPVETLLDDSCTLAGELERDGMISADTVRRIACDATIVVAVDDDVGHTDVRGQGVSDPDRYPAPGNGATRSTLPLPGLHERDLRRRAPVAPWKAGGTTDVENLALSRAPSP